MSQSVPGLLSALCKLSSKLILFSKIDVLRGGDEIKDQMMNPPRDRSGAMGVDGAGRKDDAFGVTKPNTQFIVDDIVKSYNEGKVVYCRFGK